jgi:hypothetical protein
MTSQMSRDDLEALLWPYLKPTVRADIDKIMRGIDRYVISAARKYAATGAMETDPYAWLQPGDFDTSERVGRCVVCMRVKNMDTDFVRDTSTIAGRRHRCKACTPKPKPSRLDAYYCRACKTRKELGQFPAEKQMSPALMVACTKCEGDAEDLRITLLT